jgi:hypothetical protein
MECKVSHTQITLNSKDDGVKDILDIYLILPV